MSAMWRRIIQLALCSLLAVLVIRTWVLEGLVVPVRIIGSSMAETFYGPHLKLTCLDCGFPFAFDAAVLPRPQQAICPNCGYRKNKTKLLSICRGDRLLIDKMAYNIRDPRRWEAILFRGPPLQPGYCIKRVVGLPGETIEIHHGDVFIDGVRAKKTWPELREMAMVVHDARHRTTNIALPRRWRVMKPSNGWEFFEGRFGYHPKNRMKKNKVQAADLSQQGAWEDLDWLGYHHYRYRIGSRIEEASVLDNYGYNQTISRQLNDIVDLYLVATVEAKGDGVLALRMPGDGQNFLLTLETNPPRGTLFYNGHPVKKFSWQADRLELPSILEVATVDKQFLFAIDGTPLVSFDYERPQLHSGAAALRDHTTPQTDPSTLAIGACGLELRLKDLRLLRDIYYTESPTAGLAPESRRHQLGNEEFFVLGDNSPISLDSRQAGSDGIVDAVDLLGKPWRWR